MRQGLVCAAILLLTAFAGCAGSDAKPSSTASTSTTAPPPVVGAETGSVTGIAADDEGIPLPGVSVALIETAAEATTDAQGAFTINEVPPGEYRIVASKLGYRETGKKVSVIAGEVVEVRLTLQPFSLDNEAYTLTIPRTILIHLGQRFTYAYTVGVANQSALNERFCNPCWSMIHHPPSPEQVMTEPEWPGWQPCPAINCDVWIYYKYEGTTAIYALEGSMSYYKSFRSRESYLWSDAAANTLKGKDRVMLALNPAYYGSVEQKVTTYTSFAYNGDFPEEFTALPPTG